MVPTRLTKISWAEPHHVDALIPLLGALHRHDIATTPAPSPALLAGHARRLLDPATPHRLVIAWDDQGVAIGLAAIAVFVSISDPRPERCRQMELKELFVLPVCRGMRVGEALIGWVEKQAVATNVSRIDWHVKSDNRRGIAFYQRMGAAIVEDRLSMRKPVPSSAALTS